MTTLIKTAFIAGLVSFSMIGHVNAQPIAASSETPIDVILEDLGRETTATLDKLNHTSFAAKMAQANVEMAVISFPGDQADIQLAIIKEAEKTIATLEAKIENQIAASLATPAAPATMMIAANSK